jgi:hypothetical protein
VLPDIQSRISGELKSSAKHDCVSAQTDRNTNLLKQQHVVPLVPG